MKLTVLNSKIDSSINVIEEYLAGFIEARYVRKCDEYFIAYLSSQNNCRLGCSFCHLSYTGQTKSKDLTIDQMIVQAKQIFDHYKIDTARPSAKYYHVNFMARGEFFSNKIFLEAGDELLYKLAQIGREEGLPVKFNISTIMPLTLKKPLNQIFNYINPTIYYSLYSTNVEWRKKWLPAAMPVDDALSMLKEYQNFSKKIVKIHYAFIKEENDSLEEVAKVCDALDQHRLICEFNLVRYNPASPEQGEESSEEVIKRNMEYIEKRMRGNKTQIIQRVAPDIYGSCGCFFS